jgi:hypothetical protein
MKTLRQELPGRSLCTYFAIALPTSAGSGNWARCPHFPQTVISPLSQSISSRSSLTTSPARSPKRASSNRMA